MSAPDMKKLLRWIAPAVVVVVILVLLLMWPGRGPDVVAPDPSPAGSSTAGGSAFSSNMKLEPEAAQAIEPPTSSRNPEVKVLPMKPLESSEAPAGIQFQDLSGKPIAGLACRVMPWKRAESVNELIAAAEVVAYGQDVTSDDAGLVRCTPDLVPQLLSLVDQNWRIADNHRTVEERVLKLGEGVFSFPATGTRIVRLFKGTGIPVRITWADGQPFDGEAYWFASRSKKTFASGVIGVVGGYGLIENGPENCGLVCNVKGVRRKGFETRAGVVMDVQANPYVEFEIPYARGAQYGFELDLMQLKQGDTVSIEMCLWTGLREKLGTQHGPGRWQSPGFSQIHKNCWIEVDGACVWKSPKLTLDDAENWPVLVVEKLAPIELRARILDKTGSPIRGSILVSDPSIGPLAHFANTTPSKPFTKGERATSDTEGNIRFVDLPAGTHEIRAAAPGHYSKVVRYEAAAGGSIDLGEIVLDQIPVDKNFIRVVLKDQADPTLYKCSVSYVGTDTVRPPRKFSAEGELRFEQLDYGDYVVAVSAAKGGIVWQQRVKLTPETAEHVLSAALDNAESNHD